MRENRRNAIIMAAGTSSRFVPLSAEIPKGLIEVKGEVLIERQIRQLQESGIKDIIVVVGYKAEMFDYLKEKFDVKLVFNKDYDIYNNTSSLFKVLDKLDNTYLCSSDNYFSKNVFMEDPTNSYYSALYAEGETCEYCLTTDANDFITSVSIGGKDSWYMIGHVYFSKNFSDAFKLLLTSEYEKEEVRMGYWEDVYVHYINQLPPMRIRRYDSHDIEEFDSIDELRKFDLSYVFDTRSTILKNIAKQLNCLESDLYEFSKLSKSDSTLRFSFEINNITYCYDDEKKSVTRL